MQSHPQPVASVIVPTHRGAHRLPPLLAALATQDCADPWEVVVVVDGRDPETEGLLAGHRDLLPLRVLVRDRSSGVAAALNAGYAAATGEVLIRCDDDLTPAPDMVRRHVAHHRSATEPLGVMGATRDALPDTPYARAYGRPANARALAAAYARPEHRRWMGWAAHNSVTQSTWDAVGGFDESYAYREDSDLGLRLAEQGVRLLVDPELEVEHRGAAADTRTRASRAWVSGASEVLFAVRHPGVATPDAGAPAGARARLWSAATTALATVLPGRRAAARAGQVVDRLLPHLPVTVGSRAVALVVEASAQAGRRGGSAQQESYRAQKTAEVEAERRSGR